MKYFRALLMFLLLAFSERYRRRWRRTTRQIDATNDAVDRSKRRIEIMEHGGRPEDKLPDRSPPS